MGQLRTVVEAWPALLSEEMAARYLSVEQAVFRRVVARFRVEPVDIGEDYRWRKSDLDQLIKRLPTISVYAVEASEKGSAHLSEFEVGRIADAVARRLERGTPAVQRTVVSIKEAGTLLGIGRSTIYRMIETGELEPRRLGRRTLIPLSQIQALLEGGG